MIRIIPSLSSRLLTLCAGLVGLQLLVAGAAGAFTLTVDSGNHMVGESTVYRITGAPANAQIFWSSWKDGVSTGEVNVYYGQTTDADGAWTALASPWLAAHVGSWIKQATVNGQAASVSFNVTPRLLTDKGVYVVGTGTTYTLRGAPPNSPIFWSSWLNGASTGEVNVYYGQNTDASGNWSALGGNWSSAHVGTWIKQATVGGRTVQVTFQVRSTALTATQQKVGIEDFRPGQLADGAARIANLGGRVARLVLSPDCSQQRPATLLELASGSDARQAFANPSIDAYALTTFDRTSLCNDNTRIYTDPNFYTPANTSAVEAEYSDLTLYLYRTFHDTGKRFYISNWEGDNAVYCQSAYSYVNNFVGVWPGCSASMGFRDCCNLSYSTQYRGVPNPAASIAGIQLWLAARQQGVTAGRNQALAEGITGVTVLQAPEMNSIHLLAGPDLDHPVYKSMLTDVFPYISWDAVLYSAYESTNVFPPNGLSTDLSTISSRLHNTNQIAIGEFGYDRQVFSDSAIASQTDQVLNIALGWNGTGVLQTFHWVLTDDNHFGLFDQNFNLLPIGAYYQNKFSSP